MLSSETDQSKQSIFAIAKAKGQRLQRLRHLANLKRAEVAAKYDSIKFNTLRNWELGEYKGIPRKSAEKMLLIYEQEGIICTLDWLMTGRGIGPRIIDKTNLKNPDNNQTPKKKQQQEKQIIQELLNFRNTTPNSTDYFVNNDNMSPCFLPGDYLGGIKYYGEDINQLIGQNCIVQTQNNQTLLCHLENSPTKNYYALTTNQMQKTTQLITAAQITWLRRPSG